MGYDMYLTGGATEGETLARKAAAEAFDATVAERSKHKRGTPAWDAAQAKVEEADEALDAARTEYFRLNISGMGYCLDWMFTYGMAFPAKYEGDWPEYPKIPDDATAEQEDHLHDTYTGAARPFLSQHPDGTLGIPSFKFGSNDGWIVTEDECAYAVKAWEEAGSPVPEYEGEPVRWWPRWIEFLRRGSIRGGFAVR